MIYNYNFYIKLNHLSNVLKYFPKLPYNHPKLPITLPIISFILHYPIDYPNIYQAFTPISPNWQDETNNPKNSTKTWQKGDYYQEYITFTARNHNNDTTKQDIMKQT